MCAAVDGIGFVAIDLTIENTAGAENEQAVALLSKLNHKLGPVDNLC